MNAPRSLVAGTAGHIDHGKTSLVRALTGIDTDRLAEEKRRGISIDIGFAHLKLASGESISFVDVPGHERFVRNMLAGAAGIEAVLLVVAADESVKPQTREHFDICRLLGLKRGIVVLTKADLASAGQLQEDSGRCSALDGRVILGGRTHSSGQLRHSPRFSGTHPCFEDVGINFYSARCPRLARLPIDRSFALKGFGAVVTGTLWGGTLRVGETVLVHPLDREARIRGLQTHGSPWIRPRLVEELP